MKSKKKWLIVGLLMMVIGIATFFIFRNTNEDKQQDEIEKEFQEITKDQDDNDKSGKKLKQSYENQVGWIRMKGTELSYPVMQTGTENHSIRDKEFYLHKDVHQNYSFYGTPFLDSRCDSDSDNQIIYGHNINGRRYFGFLQNLRDYTFYKKHKNIYYARVGEVEEQYRIISVMETDIYSNVYKSEYTTIYNEDDYKSFVKEIISKSKFGCEPAKEVQKTMEEEDTESFFHKYQFVTLSTCRTSEGRSKRLLIVAYRERN